MSGVFRFLGGLISLGAAGAMGIKEDMEQEAKNREYRSHNYNYAVQSRYDHEDWRMWQKYDCEKVMAAVMVEYPRMNDMWAYLVAKAAVGKTLMEIETDYEYQIPDDIIRANLGDITRFVTDDMKIEVVDDYYLTRRF